MTTISTDTTMSSDRTPTNTVAHDVGSCRGPCCLREQADSVMVLDVGRSSGICDYFVICSARTRLVVVAEEIEDHVAVEFDRRPMSVED